MCTCTGMLLCMQAVEPLTALLDENRALLEAYVDESLVSAFIAKLMDCRDKDDIELLASLCAVPSGPVPKLQVWHALRDRH
jgi:hypothetical protein